MLHKYLGFVSYYGKEYHGSQVQLLPDRLLKTVQGELQVNTK